ncbi:hypothetical protein [Methanobacterium sp. MBAC-LM]|jgi:hypothetical protein|uniref:hypothetical protein n=1 Tax=Methanobacterium sp. MBAC-LM TaxID=3412034 RepID=UPI003C7317FC
MSGCVFLNIITANETIINAASVPIFTSWTTSVIGTNAAIAAPIEPITAIPVTGVLYFQCIFI